MSEQVPPAASAPGSSPSSAEVPPAPSELGSASAASLPGSSAAVSSSAAPPLAPSLPAPGSHFIVRTARMAWPGGPEAGKNALCDEWIKEASAIGDEERRQGADRAYVAWASITGLYSDVCNAYQALGGPGGLALDGPTFAARFVRPAQEVLSGSDMLALWVIKHPEISGAPEGVAQKVRAALAGAARPVLDLAQKDFSSVPAVGREDAQETQYWSPLTTGLQQSGELLAALCPRMMNVRNAATTCGLARRQDADACIVLYDGQEIRALASRTVGPVLDIHQITVRPRSLQQGVKGIGGVLMEYLIREAAAANSGAGVSVTLEPIGDLAKEIYAKMGFTPGQDRWVMGKPAQQKYLITHTVFKASFKAAT